jgi:hypothetical protein
MKWKYIVRQCKIWENITLLRALSGIIQKVRKIWENTKDGNIKLGFVGQQV